MKTVDFWSRTRVRPVDLRALRKSTGFVATMTRTPHVGRS